MMAGGRQRGQCPGTHCKICGAVLEPGNPYGRLCRDDHRRHRNRRQQAWAAVRRAGRAPVPISPLGRAPGLDVPWPHTPSDSPWMARQKFIRAAMAQMDVLAGRSIRVIPIGVTLTCPIERF